jgi:hypothetical protein
MSAQNERYGNRGDSDEEEDGEEDYNYNEEEDEEEDHEHISENENDEITDSENSENENLETEPLSSPNAAQSKHHYENNSTKPLIKKGNLTLSVGEAKLYGLLNENGELKSIISKEQNGKIDSKKLKEHCNKLSTTKDLSPLLEIEKQKNKKICTFQPKRSNEAMQAMKNPRCGYDFISRLGDQGDFIERSVISVSLCLSSLLTLFPWPVSLYLPFPLHSVPLRQFNESKKGKGESKFVLEGLKEDYEARLDRLQCPKCRKYQSFDEFLEKRRTCGPCQQRFVKLHVSKFKSWEAKQAEREAKKEAKLKKMNDEVYGVCSFTPQVTQMSVVPSSS